MSCSCPAFCGPPGFTGLSSPYRKTCIESSFLPGTTIRENSLNCITTYANRGKCYFDADCSNPPSSSNYLSSGVSAVNNAVPDGTFPKVIHEVSSAEELKEDSGSGSGRGLAAVCKHPLVILQGHGETSYYCPIPSESGTQPACRQTMQNLWQCSQFPDGSEKRYLCNEMENCFAYNAQYPDGSVHPALVKMNDFCLGVASAAMEQSASRCTTCTPGPEATCANGSIAGLFTPKFLNHTA